MSRRKILIVINYELYKRLTGSEVENKLETLGDVILIERDREWSSELLTEKIPNIDAVINSWGSPSFTKDVLKKANKLKFIGHAAGPESVKQNISNVCEEIFDRGITLVNAGETMGISVAELALGLAITSLHNIVEHNFAMKAEKTWRDKSIGENRELYGKKVGVIGVGCCGRQFIRFLVPFNVEILAYDPYLSQKTANELGVRLTSLENVLSNCDVIALHAASNKETRRMIGERELRLVKDGAVFVNTARAALIDTKSFLSELKTGRFKAALDVFDSEPLDRESEFRNLKNVIVTPHIGGRTIELAKRMLPFVVEDLALFFSGHPVKHAVAKRQLLV